MSDPLTLYKQIYPTQMSKLYALGYRSFINMRPDHEEDNQPNSAQFAKAAEQAQISYAYLPFDGGRLSKDTVNEFARLYHTLPKPILMCCRTGARAKLLYQSALMQGLL